MTPDSEYVIVGMLVFSVVALAVSHGLQYRLIERRLDEVVFLLSASANREVETMALVDELKAELVKANDATNNIAADIVRLNERLAAGTLTEAEATEIRNELSALAVRLEGVAAVTPES